MMSLATAGIDAKYVAAAGQPGPHGIQLAVLALQSLLWSFRPLLLKGSHAKTPYQPITQDRSIDPHRAYTTPEFPSTIPTPKGGGHKSH